ncbi:MAG: hypothetical protein AAFZ99_12650 [Pseudomonadota bacterium]
MPIADPKIPFEHIILKLQSQREDLTSIRNRASISAAITGLIAAFFASAIGAERLQVTLKADVALGLSPAAAMLFLVFILSLAFAAMTILIREEVSFSFDAVLMLEKRHELSEAEFFRLYVTDGEWYFTDNERKIDRAQSYLFFSVTLGWSQVFAWILVM